MPTSGEGMRSSVRDALCECDLSLMRALLPFTRKFGQSRVTRRWLGMSLGRCDLHHVLIRPDLVN